MPKLAAGELVDLLPTFCEEAGEWQVSINDERGNCVEQFGFASEEEALAFIDSFIFKG